MPRVYHKVCALAASTGWNALSSTRWKCGFAAYYSRLQRFLCHRLEDKTIHQNFCNFFLFNCRLPSYKTAPEEFIDSASRQILLGIAVLALIVPPASADLFPDSGPVVSGKTAHLRFGRAAAPKHAPLAVKRAIWAANQLRSKPYRYGGGHKSFDDRGYDCSGTVSYVLAAAGLISSPISSTEFRGYGERGPGKWITIYARDGHTFAVIAGLRLDTTPFDHYTGKWAPRWQTVYRPPRGFDARHPIGL
ncbi:MAG: hypothetical protein DME52_06030 [Verrucomicrobia bacterium]|nr:MAG: hypothetical protein DME84_02845 [Verrucomicrobiota bacterium]PYK26505.1 MAG: hypothetical protein DME52_06030 [Verrucomicrobiota bacterium]PYK52405.1 MAG: hypothetical protein DME51_00345 [Verrucomicrobiota bacterium]